MFTWEPFNTQQMVQLRKVCRQVAATIPTLQYAGYAIRLLSMHPAITEPGMLIRPHQHTFYEGIVFLHGNARELSGEQQHLPPGTIMLHAPGLHHGWQAQERTVYRLGLWLSILPAITVPPPACWPQPAHIMQELSALVAEAQEPRVGWEDRLHARLLLLLSHFLALGDLAATDKPMRRHADSLVSLAQRFIRDNLAAPLTLADIAEQIGVSVPTLTRQVRAETGLSVMDYVLAQRMHGAARLLREGDNSIAEVGASVGIPDTSYFCRRFKQFYGISPRRYRTEPSPPSAALPAEG